MSEDRPADQRARRGETRRGSLEVDRRLVAELRRDARQSNVALAKKVGLTEGAVRRRLDNLVASGALRFTAVADPALLGSPTQALLRIRCAPHLVDDVIAELRQVAELERVYHCTGPFDLTAVGSFASTASLRDFTVNRVGAIPGIVEMQSELILEAIEPFADIDDAVDDTTTLAETDAAVRDGNVEVGAG